MRIAVIGSAGQLGTDLVDILRRAEDYEVFGFGHQEIECSNPVSIEKALERVHPEIVVNCAAFVRVDDAENRPEEAFRVNSVGALNVARACARLDALCVYVSTDFVFDGTKGAPYTETDTPHPINVYGVSKLAGEYLVQANCRRWLIARMASLFGRAGSSGKGGNWVETILAKARAGERLRLIDDVWMSPTYSRDAAQALERLFRQKTTGIFHLTNLGNCTWYEFACKTLDLAGLGNQVEPISSANYPAQARRPRNSSLETTKLDLSLKETRRPWAEALKDYLAEKGHLLLRR
jgi:dTDP-4-dehydrorhamnose reductase